MKYLNVSCPGHPTSPQGTVLGDMRLLAPLLCWQVFLQALPALIEVLHHLPDVLGRACSIHLRTHATAEQPCSRAQLWRSNAISAERQAYTRGARTLRIDCFWPHTGHENRLALLTCCTCSTAPVTAVPRHGTPERRTARAPGGPAGRRTGSTGPPGSPACPPTPPGRASAARAASAWRLRAPLPAGPSARSTAACTGARRSRRAGPKCGLRPGLGHQRAPPGAAGLAARAPVSESGASDEPRKARQLGPRFWYTDFELALVVTALGASLGAGVSEMMSCVDIDARMCFPLRAGRSATPGRLLMWI